MLYYVAAIPAIATGAIIAVEVVTKTSVLSIESVVIGIGAISASVALAWKGRGEFDRLSRGIDQLQRTVDNLPCVCGRVCKCPQEDQT